MPIQKPKRNEINKRALEVVLNGTVAERLYLCERDFSLFFCYYFPDYMKYDFAPYHFGMFRDIRDMIQRKTLRETLWLMFRESAKTSFAKIVLAWLIVFRKKWYINVDSYDRENAERILYDLIVEFQTNPRLLADFGKLYDTRRDPDNVTQKRVANFVIGGVRVEAHSTQETVRGRLHREHRPDFLLLDDFETNKTKDSKAYTDQVISHINEFKSGLDSTANVLYLGNYITEYGSVQTLLDRAKTDKRLKVRRVDVIENGKPSWPAKYALTDSEAALTGKVSLEDKRRQLGSQVFMTEMMNTPIDEESQEFYKKWFKYRSLDEAVSTAVHKYATIDTALSKNAKSDFTGITKNYVNAQNEWNIDAQRYKINPKELIEIIFKLFEDGFEKIGIEEGAYVDAILPFMEDEQRRRDKYPPIVILKHGGIMKETRIRGLIPRYEAGMIYHIEGKCAALEEEAMRFPKAAHDDVIDSLAYMLKISGQAASIEETRAAHKTFIGTLNESDPKKSPHDLLDQQLKALKTEDDVNPLEYQEYLSIIRQ